MVGWCVSPSAFMTGGIIGAGSTAGRGLAAVLLGNLLLVVIASLVGIIGCKTGFTTYSILRIVFGKKGSLISSLLIGILAMGFIGVLLNAFGLSLHSLIPSIPVWLAIVIFSVCVTSTAILGFKGLSFISNIAAPILWIFLALGVFVTAKNVGSFGSIFAITPKNPLPFVVCVGAAFTTWVTGAAIVCDVMRYAKKPSHVIIASIFGYIAGAAVFEFSSVLTAIGVGSSNIVNVMASLGLLIPGVVILALALWTTTDNNIYSTALAFTNLSEIIKIKVSKPVWTIIAISIALITSLFGLATKFLVWLNLIGILAPPLAGIMIAHFWILNYNKKDMKIPEGIRISAFIAWIISALIAKYSNFAAPAFISITSSFIIYLILSKLMDREPNLISK